MKVTLRPSRPEDGDWLASWLPPLTALLRYPDDPASLGDGSDAVVHVFQRDGADAGIIVHRTEGERAVIELVAAAPGQARRGAGMAAAVLLEDQLARGGVRTLYAPVAETHGISMYFWMRLGYRPLLRAAWPCEQEGIVWLRRDIARGVRRTA